MELELYNTKLKYEDDMLLRWVDRRGVHKLKTPYWRIVKQTPDKDGNSKIKINKKMYMYHRVVYKVCNPEWDIYDVSRENEIDHICGTRPKDNRIENLRILNNQQNKCNNLHYAKGYYFNKSMNKYQAQIKTKEKIKYLGCYDTAEEAREAYLKAKAIHHPL